MTGCVFFQQQLMAGLKPAILLLAIVYNPTSEIELSYFAQAVFCYSKMWPKIVMLFFLNPIL